MKNAIGKVISYKSCGEQCTTFGLTKSCIFKKTIYQVLFHKKDFSRRTLVIKGSHIDFIRKTSSIKGSHIDQKGNQSMLV